MNNMYRWATVDKRDLKKDLRYAFKSKLLNSFGKSIGESICIEKQKVIEWIKKEYVGFGYNKYGPDFSAFFNKVFEKETKECKK